MPFGSPFHKCTVDVLTSFTLSLKNEIIEQLSSHLLTPSRTRKWQWVHQCNLYARLIYLITESIIINHIYIVSVYFIYMPPWLIL